MNNLKNILLEQSYPDTYEGKVKRFQDWLDINYPAWYKGGKLNKGEGYGTYGPNTERMADDTTVIKKYENWKASGGNFPKPEDNLNNYDASIVEVSKWVRFYDSSNRLLEILDYETSNDNNFNSNKNVIELVKSAQSLMLNQNLSPIVSYIKAAVRKYPNIKSFSVPETYSGDLDKYKGQILSENKIIKPVIGLSKLLLEQPTNRKTYEITTGADNKKYLGGERTYNNRGNINVESVISNYLNNQTKYFAPLSLNPGNLPDFAPLIGQVKIKLNIADGNNIFNKTLEDKIIDYREQKGISYRDNPGFIDFPLVQSLFKSDFDSAESSRQQGTTQPSTSSAVTTPTQVTEIKLPKSFETLMWYVNNVQRQIQQRTQIDFDYCKYIYNEYPKLAINAKKLMDLEKDNSITANNSELKKIKSSIDACATSRKLQTTGSKVKDFLNVFERGVNSIKNLPEPFNLNINS